MSFQGASGIVPTMRQSGKGRVCVPQHVLEGFLSSTSDLSLGRGFVRSPHLGLELRERPLLLLTRDFISHMTQVRGEDMSRRDKC